ncbi:anti-sigma factor antagonist [bacterium]|jgi:anti-anti-sigma factor|nr:anti-sigma factor antagonist [bacterium]MBT3582161.1 anti-sigma factor antagonist [bacterium]MBT4551741.1 anti-sigma factor antagonist [bacterium]MBT5988298.1 anti-sigma factor antagonist [bacterium]MBT7088157.1 anti-sigma factor antagonist [bacterium]
MELDIKITKEKNNIIVTTAGEIDDYHAPKFNDLLSKIIEKNDQQKIILNLEETTYLDSVGLGVIAIAAKKLVAKKQSLYLVCTKPQIIKLLDTSGMINLIKKNIFLLSSLKEAKEK